MALPPDAKKALRVELASFCRLAEQFESRWHYSQRRPYTGLGVAPQTYHVDDCSSYVALCFWWAGHHTGHPVADPLAMHYSGWGNTNTSIGYLDAHPAPRDKYRIGDVALYGISPSNTKHMTVCRKAGDRNTSLWSSFGQEAGPQAVKLHYRGDLLNVYRHPALL